MADIQARFERLAGGDLPPPAPVHSPFTACSGPHYLAALVAVLQDCFRLTEHDIHRNRVLVAEQGLLMNPRESPHEEQARQAARQLTRDLERLWAAFLAGAMEHGAIPDGDPRLLARAILGL